MKFPAAPVARGAARCAARPLRTSPRRRKGHPGEQRVPRSDSLPSPVKRSTVPPFLGDGSAEQADHGCGAGFVCWLWDAALGCCRNAPRWGRGGWSGENRAGDVPKRRGRVCGLCPMPRYTPQPRTPGAYFSPPAGRWGRTGEAESRGCPRHCCPRAVPARPVPPAVGQGSPGTQASRAAARGGPGASCRDRGAETWGAGAMDVVLRCGARLIRAYLSDGAQRRLVRFPADSAGTGFSPGRPGVFQPVPDRR